MGQPSLGEFDVIDGFASNPGATRDDVAIGIGDDGAVLDVPPAAGITSAVLTLSPGDRDLPNQSAHSAVGARSLGHRVLAGALTRLAGMGTTPRWATLALTVPTPDPAWLAEFRTGLAQLARAHDIALVGGDTTRGPISVTVFALGPLHCDAAVTQPPPRVGDEVRISGAQASAALLEIEARIPNLDSAGCRQRLEWPQPPITHLPALEAAPGFNDTLYGLGDACRGLATPNQLGNQLGIELEAERIPLAGGAKHVPPIRAIWTSLLSSPGDHELCWLRPPADRTAGGPRSEPAAGIMIGRVVAEAGLHLRLAGEVADVELTPVSTDGIGDGIGDGISDAR